jgi:pimeloyl-ACP methyl ester carboxylesterase
VHGSFSDYRYFTASIETLAQEHRVIALSLRHYYPERWDGQGSTFSLSQHASDVAGLVQVLGLGRVHLLGHSRGGTVALYVAQRHPELLRSLILAEGGAALRAFNPSAPAAGQSIGAADERTRTALNLLQQGRSEDAAAFFMEGVVGPGAWSAAPELVKDMYRANLWTIQGAAADVPEPFACSDISGVLVPVLLMTGETTAAVFRGVTDALQDCIKGSQRVVIPGAGHAFPRQAPREFSESLLAFTKRH